MAKNLRGVLLFGGFAAAVGAAFYPIYFRPLIYTEEYQQEQKVNRTGINQEEIQPGGFLSSLDTTDRSTDSDASMKLKFQSDEPPDF